MSLLVSNPRFNDISLPHELQEGRVVLQVGLPQVCKLSKVEHFVSQLFTSLSNCISMVVLFINQLLSSFTNIRDSVSVDRNVGLKSIMLLQKSLNCSHVVSKVRNSEKLLLLRDPGLFFFNLCKELLVGDGLCQFLSSRLCHALKFIPNIVELLKSLFNFSSTKLAYVNQLLTSILHGLNGGLMAS